jgi:phage terminase large subunit-like protein
MQRERWQMEMARMPPFRDSPVPIIYFGGEPVPPTKPQVMPKLRERGIYALADGREFVAHAVFRGGYVFYTPEGWDRFGAYSYESDSQGRLRWNGQPDQWCIEDLIDTSRTARSRSRDVA